MKTKELIKRLQEEDPSGELEVCVGCEDIYFVETQPAFYDGPQHILVRDPAKAPYYDVVGGIINYKGQKIRIHVLSLQDAIFHDPDLPISFNGGHEGNLTAMVEKWREEARKPV